MSRDDYDPDDPDAPQPMDLAADDAAEDDDETIACPGCGRRIHEQAALCPHCGEWILDDSTARRRGRGWFWPLAVGILIALILVYWSGLR
ncbi:MAG: hypothetical protein HY718_01530 [Planctomycetes bacterium]|nr:hypothetical protein [Planctomycetota bacterium]